MVRLAKLLAVFVGCCLSLVSPVLATHGAVDPTFAAPVILSGTNPGIVRTMLGQTDGSVIIGGDFTTIGGVARPYLARLRADGSLDESFPQAGAPNAPVRALLQSGTKVYVGGEFTTVGTANRARIMRIDLATGALDASFDPAAGFNGAVRCIVLDPYSGELYVGGEFTSYRGTTRNRLAALSTTGNLSSSLNGLGSNGPVNALLSLDYSNRLLVGGEFTSLMGSNCANLAVAWTSGSGVASDDLSANGPVYSFTPVGSASSYVNIAVAGNFSTIAGKARSHLALLAPHMMSPEIDPTFTPYFDGPVYAAAMRTSDWRMLVGGAFQKIDGMLRPGMAQFSLLNAHSSNTYPELTLDYPVGAGAVGSVLCLGQISDGKLYVGGSFASYSGLSGRPIVRLYGPAGSNPPAAPTAFTARGATSSDVVVTWTGSSYATSYRLERRVDSGSTWTNLGAVTMPYIDRGLANGTAYTYRVFAVNSNGESAPATSVATTLAELWTGAGSISTPATGPVAVNGTISDSIVQPDGKVLIAGSFSQVRDAGRVNIARLNADLTLDTTFNPGSGPNSLIEAMALASDGRIYIRGYFTSVSGTRRKYLARLHPDGSLDSSFAVPGDGVSSSSFDMAVQPDGRILLYSNFAISINHGSSAYIWRLNLDGTLDRNFLSAVDDARSLSVLRDGRMIVSGTFPLSSPNTDVNRLMPNGMLDETFTEQLSPFVYQVSSLPNGRALAYGSFNARLSRLKADGTTDDTFTAPSFSFVFDLALEPLPDGRTVIAGAFRDLGGTLRMGIARLQQDGSLDPSFDPGLGTTGTINDVALAANGDLIVVGSFNSFGGVPASNFAVLKNDVAPANVSTPASVQTTAISSRSLKLTWADQPSEYGWKVERSVSPGLWVTVALLPWDAPDYTDDNVSPGITYTYRVTAINPTGTATSSEAAGSPWTRFQQWKADAGLAFNASSTLDSDGDGIALITEYALGLDPNTSSVSGMPAFQMLNGALALSYQKLRTDMTYSVERSTDAITWTSTGVYQGSGAFPIAWTLTNGATQVYLRLRVTGE